MEGIENLPSVNQDIAGRFICFVRTKLLCSLGHTLEPSNIIPTQIEYLRMYINYCANHNLALARLRELIKESAKFQYLMAVREPSLFFLPHHMSHARFIPYRRFKTSQNARAMTYGPISSNLYSVSPNTHSFSR